MNAEKLFEIYNSLLDGQRKQMVKQIDVYGIEFWKHFSEYINSIALDTRFTMFVDVVNSYHLIKGE